MNKREWMLHTISLVYGSGAQLREDINLPEFFSKMYDAIIAATPETAQDGAWVEHDGDVSKAPEEEAEIVVAFRGGLEQDGHGGDFVWDHDGDGSDIIRWRYAGRVVSPEKIGHYTGGLE